TLWDNSWYGGHHLPAYSVLAPALGAAIGPQLLAAISMTAATALFAMLIDGLFPSRATRIASAWFAVGPAISLPSGRVPFGLGLLPGARRRPVDRRPDPRRPARAANRRAPLRRGTDRLIPDPHRRRRQRRPAGSPRRRPGRGVPARGRGDRRPASAAVDRAR